LAFWVCLSAGPFFIPWRKIVKREIVYEKITYQDAKNVEQFIRGIAELEKLTGLQVDKTGLVFYRQAKTEKTVQALDPIFGFGKTFDMLVPKEEKKKSHKKKKVTVHSKDRRMLNGKKIKELAKKLKTNLSTIAEVMEIGESTFYNYVQGTSKIGKEDLKNLASILEVKPKDIVK